LHKIMFLMLCKKNISIASAETKSFNFGSAQVRSPLKHHRTARVKEICPVIKKMGYYVLSLFYPIPDAGKNLVGLLLTSTFPLLLGIGFSSSLSSQNSSGFINMCTLSHTQFLLTLNLSQSLNFCLPSSLTLSSGLCISTAK